jgi:hypothetical protein
VGDPDRFLSHPLPGIEQDSFTIKRIVRSERIAFHLEEATEFGCTAGSMLASGKRRPRRIEAGAVGTFN